MNHITNQAKLIISKYNGVIGDGSELKIEAHNWFIHSNRLIRVYAVKICKINSHYKFICYLKPCCFWAGLQFDFKLLFCFRFLKVRSCSLPARLLLLLIDCSAELARFLHICIWDQVAFFFFCGLPNRHPTRNKSQFTMAKLL